jgi:hypothetical protein
MTDIQLREIYNFLKHPVYEIDNNGKINQQTKDFLLGIRRNIEQYISRTNIRYFESEEFDNGERIIIEDDEYDIEIERGYFTTDETEFVIRISPSYLNYDAIYFGLYDNNVRIGKFYDR